MTQENGNEEIAVDVVTKWTSDKNVIIKLHGGIKKEDYIILVDCVKEALDAKDLAHKKQLEDRDREIERLKDALAEISRAMQCDTLGEVDILKVAEQALGENP